MAKLKSEMYMGNKVDFYTTIVQGEKVVLGIVPKKHLAITRVTKKKAFEKIKEMLDKGKW